VLTFLTPLINSLNAELNPICHLLALLGAHHILHFSRVRDKRKNGISDFKIRFPYNINEARSGVVVKALRYKPAGREFDS
jgi:hypothetical protein